MSKTRVYELAKELNVASKEIIEKAKEVGISYNSHMSTMEEAEISKIKGILSQLLNQHQKLKRKKQNLLQNKK
mgnify:CR=1 FL=1